MAARLPTPRQPTQAPPLAPPVPLSVAQLLPLLLCLCCCVRLAAPLTEANWPPLKMHKDFTSASPVLTYEQDVLLRETVHVAVARLESLLKVLDMNPGQVLRLNRSRAYCSVWMEADKCGQVNSTYMSIGELCSADSTFRIPEEYLSEVSIYNDSQVVLRTAGKGVQNGANFILFVTIQQSSSFCIATNPRQVTAATCSQQWIARRPLAGLLRVCPQLISSELASRHGRLLQQILAGLVRMLGFSASLMADYQRLLRPPSSATDEWELLQESSILDRQYGLTFVRSPAVRSFAERHFNCSAGLPLAPGPGSDAWDPVFMFPSVMSAAPASPGVSGLDEGTLAILEDSGWYTVNYSLANRFVWGKQAGCGFSTSCSASESAHASPMFCSAANQLQSALKPDFSHRSAGYCDHIAGTNCSTILPRDSEMCNFAGNFRSLQLLSSANNDTQCLSVECPPEADTSSANYAVVRNSLRAVCPANISATRQALVDFGDGVQLLCVRISLVCPPQSSVLDLLAGFLWPQSVSNASTTATMEYHNGTSTGTGQASSAETVSHDPVSISSSTSSSTKSSTDSTRSTTRTGASTRYVSNAFSTSTTTIPVSSIQTTPTIQAHFLRQRIPQMKRGQLTTSFNQSYPPAKFTIRFEKMEYYQLVNKDLVQDFKASLQKVLADAFRISTNYLSIIDVKPGSVIGIFENSDPNADASTKLALL